MDADPALAQVIAELESTEQAAEVLDPEWRLAWGSPQLRLLLGGPDEGGLGVGLHWLESRGLPAWTGAAPLTVGMRWVRAFGPFMAHDTPGGVDELLPKAGPETRKVLPEIEPAAPPPLSAHRFEFHQPGMAPTPIGALAMRVRGEDGGLVGTAILYGSPLPAT